MGKKGSEKERGRGQWSNSLPKKISQWLNFLPQCSTSQSIMAGDQAFTRRVFGDITDLSHSKPISEGQFGVPGCEIVLGNQAERVEGSCRKRARVTAAAISVVFYLHLWLSPFSLVLQWWILWNWNFSFRRSPIYQTFISHFFFLTTRP